MKKYYKVLGLETNATLEEVKKKYNDLSKEFDPSKQPDELKDFFIAEQKKLDAAFEKISSSLSEDIQLFQIKLLMKIIMKIFL